MRRVVEHFMSEFNRLSFPLSIFALLVTPFYFCYMIVFDRRVPCYVLVPWEGHLEFLEVWPE